MATNRKLVIGDKQYRYRVGKKFIAIDCPDNTRIQRTIWDMKGMTEREWELKRLSCGYGNEDCVDCSEPVGNVSVRGVTPKEVRALIQQNGK